MKKIVLFVVIIGLVILGCFYFLKRPAHAPKLRLDKASLLQNGDIVFQTSVSAQSKAIQLATGSQYSHCGLVYKEGNVFYVFEAVQPVKRTLLKEWIARGQDGHYVVKRLKNAESLLTATALRKMKKIGDGFKGKRYDLAFEWSDDRMYCSELVWKIYKQALRIELGKLQKLEDFDLTSTAVKQKMQERYGSKIPKEELVISPAAIFESKHLRTVLSN